MSLNLGDVNFGLGADTKGLQKAMRRLGEFQKKVDSIVNSQQKGSAAAANQFAKQESAVRRALVQVSNLNRQMREAGAPPQLLAQNTNAFKSLTRAMTQTEMTAVDFNRAQDKFTAQMNKNRVSLNAYTKSIAPAGKKTGSFSRHIRDLESASVLAVGPLSGLGARIQALGSITARGTLGLALLFGTITGGVVALGALVRSAVVARREMEAIEVAFRAAVGSTFAARKEFEFLTDVTRKYGIELRQTAKQYSRFIAAAAGSNMSLEDSRTLFDGVAAAASVFNLNAQDLHGVMKALEQIMSKGTVSSDELRRQFAERIPGAMKIAADAMEVTEAELNRMLARGEIMATEMLPKLGQELQKVFGEDAIRASTNLESSIQGVQREWFLFANSLDRVINASGTFQRLLDTVSAGLIAAQNNIRTIVAVVASLGSGLLAFGAASFVVNRATASWKALTDAVWASRAAFAATATAARGATTASVAFVRSIGGGVFFGAVAALTAISVVFSNVRAETNDTVEELDALKVQLQEIAAFGDDPNLRLLKQSEGQIMAAEAALRRFSRELQDNEAEAIELERQLQKAQEQASKFAVGSETGNVLRMQVANLLERLEANNLKAEEIRQKFAEWQTVLLDAEEGVEKMNDQLEGSKGLSEATTKAIKELTDQFGQLQRVQQIEALIDQGATLDAIQNLRDLHEAQKFLKDVPVAEQDQLRISLEEMGFAVSNLPDGIARMIRLIREGGEAASQYENNVQGMKEATKEMNAEIRNMQMVTDAFNFGGFAGAEQAMQIAEMASKTNEWREALEAGGVPQERINTLMRTFFEQAREYDEVTRQVKEWVKAQETAPAAIDALNQQIGRSIALAGAASRGYREWIQLQRRFDQQDEIAKLNESLIAAGVSIQQAAMLTNMWAEAQKEYNTAAEGMKRVENVIKSLKQGIERAMDDVGEAITQAFVSGEKAALSFRNVAASVIQSIIQAITRATIINPILDAVFGAISGAGSGGTAAAASGSGGGTGIPRFAKGGVVSGKTQFTAAGSRGIMGEQGPEAVLPLKRTSSGNLGVELAGSSGGTTIVIEGDTIDARNMTPETLAQLMPLLKQRDEALVRRIQQVQNRRPV